MHRLATIHNVNVTDDDGGDRQTQHGWLMSRRLLVKVKRDCLRQLLRQLKLKTFLFGQWGTG